MPTGSLALILHAHLPFVRHPEHDEFLEEDWLYEAILETYIPLIRLLRRLAEEDVEARLSLTMTPPLCEMLRDPLLQSRAERYLARGVELARAEVERTAEDEAVQRLAKFYRTRFEESLDFYTNVLDRDIVGAFAQLQDEGRIEIITCAATHGFLPLMENHREAMRAQILIGRDSYRECFGRDPRGIWLPECAYVQGVGELLREAGIRWFVVDAHGLMFGQPKPRFAIYSPYFLPAGPAVFGRDRDSSRQVWSAQEGYPGDPAYREFYRDIGQDLPEEYLGRFLKTDHRRFTGIKYHRVTGNPEKELYHRSWAEAAADSHATHFLESRVEQIANLASSLPVEPIVVSPFDAELFGHWWYEGPEFLELFLRKAAFDQDTFTLTTPEDYLQRHPTLQLVSPSPSSWGNKGYWEVWLDHCNSWIYPHLHAAARRMIRSARKHADDPTPEIERLLRQMARELLLAQASDWAFLMKTGTASEYATKRTKDHILRFNRLYDGLEAGLDDSEFLAFCEDRDNLFADVNWRHYL
ncbi:MAG: 1,4-alpha-glucan branching protein domain-containing protein [Chthoniobacterales bacterium]